MTNEEQINPTTLYFFIAKEDVNNVKRLLDTGIDRQIVDETGQTFLHYAAATGNLAIVKLLLEYNLGKTNLIQFIIKRDKKGRTALHAAAEVCAIGVIQYLRTRSENQLDNIQDNKHFSALDVIRAIQTKRKVGNEKLSDAEKTNISNAIKALIANPKLDKAISNLLQNIEHGNLNAVQQLINNTPELLESRNKYTNTPLFEAIYSKQFEVAAALLEQGADVNARCHEGKSPLHRAVWVRDKKIILELIKKGANIEALDDHGTTPFLDAAGVDNNIEIIEILLSQGAMITACNGLKRNCIHVAAAIIVILILNIFLTP